MRPSKDGAPAEESAWLSGAWGSATAGVGATDEVGEGGDAAGPSPFRHAN